MSLMPSDGELPIPGGGPIVAGLRVRLEPARG